MQATRGSCSRAATTGFGSSTVSRSFSSASTSDWSSTRCWATTTTSCSARRAHLFRAHPFARELKSDADLLVACRYVARNPVEAGLCRDPFSWPCSSAAACAGLADPAIPLDSGPLRAALGDTDDWQRRYREFVEAGADGRR
jgi:hypothetical protein